MDNKTICSLTTSKLLKELYFEEVTNKMYCTDVQHKGKSISYEEELDLKFEGKSKEIEYVKYGKVLTMNNKNGEYKEACSAPTILEAVDWIRRTFDIHITVVPEWRNKPIYGANVYYFEPKQNDYAKLLTPQYFNQYEDCMEYAIKKALEYVKSLKTQK